MQECVDSRRVEEVVAALVTHRLGAQAHQHDLVEFDELRVQRVAVRDCGGRARRRSFLGDVDKPHDGCPRNAGAAPAATALNDSPARKSVVAIVGRRSAVGVVLRPHRMALPGRTRFGQPPQPEAARPPGGWLLDVRARRRSPAAIRRRGCRVGTHSWFRAVAIASSRPRRPGGQPGAIDTSCDAEQSASVARVAPIRTHSGVAPSVRLGWTFHPPSGCGRSRKNSFGPKLHG